MRHPRRERHVVSRAERRRPGGHRGRPAGLPQRGHEVTALVPTSRRPASRGTRRLAHGSPRDRARRPAPDRQGRSRDDQTVAPPRALRRDRRARRQHSRRALSGRVLRAARACLPRVASARAPLHAPSPRWGRERLVAYLNEPISVLLERSAVRRCARILVLSDFSRSLLATDHPDESTRSEPSPGGSRRRRSLPETADGPPGRAWGSIRTRRLLVTVRRAEPRMGIEQLLRAMLIARRRRSSSRRRRWGPPHERARPPELAAWA